MDTTTPRIKQTPQQRANTLDALNNLWPSVPPENVIRNLNAWRKDCTGQPPDCGTVACFGGWCAWWPAFRAQGVIAGGGGGPLLTDRSPSFYVSDHLFGAGLLFTRRGGMECDDPFDTDHECVTRRLQWLLENSEVEA